MNESSHLTGTRETATVCDTCCSLRKYPSSIQCAITHCMLLCISVPMATTLFPWQSHIHLTKSSLRCGNPVAIAIVGVALSGGKGGGWCLRGGWWVGQYRDHTRTHIRGTCGLCVCKRVCVWIETADRCFCN